MSNEELVCEDCGVSDDTVSYQYEPMELEKYSIRTLMVLCDICYAERSIRDWET